MTVLIFDKAAPFYELEIDEEEIILFKFSKNCCYLITIF